MRTQRGFTLIELMVVMGLFAILSSFVVVNMLRPQVSTSLQAVRDVLVSDLRSQQIKSINGYGNELSGIRFYSNSYVLFTGEDEDLTINLEDGNSFSNIDLPQSELVFSKNGAVSNYSETENTVTLEHSSGNQVVITISKYGVVDEE
jgi:prepilin-type N-terminal cleavage/methylation domain-containing protein